MRKRGSLFPMIPNEVILLLSYITKKAKMMCHTITYLRSVQSFFQIVSFLDDLTQSACQFKHLIFESCQCSILDLKMKEYHIFSYYLDWTLHVRDKACDQTTNNFAMPFWSGFSHGLWYWWWDHTQRLWTFNCGSWRIGIRRPSTKKKQRSHLS